MGGKSPRGERKFHREVCLKMDFYFYKGSPLKEIGLFLVGRPNKLSNNFKREIFYYIRL
jgi:hypothetical protein